MGARVARARGRPCSSARSTSARCSRTSSGTSTASYEVPPGVDVDAFRPLPREEALARLLDEARRDPPNPGNANERLPDEGNAERFAAFFARAGPDGRLLRQADLQQGRPPAARGARRPRREGGDRRLRRLPRRSWRRSRPSARSSRARSSIGISRRCCRCATSPSSRRSSRRRSAWSRPRPPPPECRRSSRGTRASPRSPKGSRPSTRPSARRSTSFTNGDVAELRDKLAALLALPGRRARARSARRRGARPSSAGAGRASRNACLRASNVGARWATRRSSARTSRSASRVRGVRERHGLHRRGGGGVRDPRSARRSSSRTASRSCRPRRRGTPLEEHLVGELIASEVEVRTGRCETFAEAAARDGRAPRAAARARASRSASSLGCDGHASVEPLAGPAHHRHAALPRNDEILRYVVWRNNTFGLHVHVGIRGADRAVAVCNLLRNFLPELLALSASSPFVEDVEQRPALRAHGDLHAHVPALRRAGRVRRLERLRAATSASSTTRARSTSTRRSGGACARTSRTRRSRSASATREPDLAEAQSLAALIYTLTARLARALDEGEPVELLPHRLIEENLWRAIRYGLSGELIDLTTGDVRPARAHIERLIEWVLPVAEELGTAHAALDPGGERRRAAAGAPRAGRDAAGDLRRAGRRGRAGSWLRTGSRPSSSRSRSGS